MIFLSLTCLAVICVYGIPPLLSYVRGQLESRFPRTQIAPHDEIAGMIALGGSYDRVRAAAELAERFPDAPLIITGRSRSEQELARSLSFGRDTLIIEPKATSTYENGLFTAEILTPKPKGRWLLITSAYHMPRAMGVFQAIGIPVEPWPVFGTGDLDPTLAYQLIHEVFGLVVYRLKGRTKAFFPGPA